MTPDSIPSDFDGATCSTRIPPVKRDYGQLETSRKSHIPRRRAGSTGRCNTSEAVDLTPLPSEIQSVRQDLVKTYTGLLFCSNLLLPAVSTF
jgi:hypothetical protein